MKNLFINIAVLLMSLSVSAQDFNVLLIPDSLKKDANVVKRYEEYVVEIKSPAKAKIYKRHVYTILNWKAQSFAKYVTGYDNLSSINSISGVLYNAFGKEIKHLKKKDWQDMSAFDGFSLMNDDRIKVNEFFYNDYPFTVDYEEEDEEDGIRGITDWDPVSSFNMSVQYSKYTIIAPADYQVRFKPCNYTTPPMIIQTGDKKSYTWEIKNIPAYKHEEGSPDLTEIVPHVILAPSLLEVEGYKGDWSTWESYGRFMYQMVEGRDVLPDAIKKKVHELTDGLSNERDKINTLYEFMQKNTHYISIQLGIGGWRPFDATYVAEKKYGDCKALSNFMIALLKEAGIKAKYTEIYGGREHPKFIEDFPSSQSNHVISCVPMGKDTIWLECTNQTVSPGYMGSSTGDRKAIIIDETGGHVVNTPRYTSKENVTIRTINATVDGEGALDALIKTRYSGIDEELPHALMKEASADIKQRYLNEMFSLPTYDVVSSEYSEKKGIIPEVQENLHIKAKAFASITGKRLFIAPNIISVNSDKLIADTARKYDYIIDQSFTRVDSILIKIPDGYKLESTPKEAALDTKFGKYISSVKLEGNQIVFYRKRVQEKMRVAASEYNDLVKFFDQIHKADRARVVLVKQE